MAGFMSGFGQAFVQSFNAADERRAKEKDDMFKLSLADAMSRRDKMDEWKREDRKTINKAKSFAKLYGAPEDAWPEIYQLLQTGDDTSVAKAIVGGQFKPKSPIPAPDQAAQAPKPSMEAQMQQSGMAAPEAPMAPEMPEMAGNSNPMPDAFGTGLKGFIAKNESRVKSRDEEERYSKIGKVMGTTPDEVKKLQGEYTPESPESKYDFVPAKPVEPLKEEVEARWRFKLAAEAGDKAGMKKYSQMIQSYTEKTEAEKTTEFPTEEQARVKLKTAQAQGDKREIAKFQSIVDSYDESKSKTERFPSRAEAFATGDEKVLQGYELEDQAEIKKDQAKKANDFPWTTSAEAMARADAAKASGDTATANKWDQVVLYHGKDAMFKENLKQTSGFRQWIVIDPATGQKTHVLGQQSPEGIFADGKIYEPVRPVIDEELSMWKEFSKDSDKIADVKTKQVDLMGMYDVSSKMIKAVEANPGILTTTAKLTEYTSNFTRNIDEVMKLIKSTGMTPDAVAALDRVEGELADKLFTKQFRDLSEGRAMLNSLAQIAAVRAGKLEGNGGDTSKFEGSRIDAILNSSSDPKIFKQNLATYLGGIESTVNNEAVGLNANDSRIDTLQEQYGYSPIQKVVPNFQEFLKLLDPEMEKAYSEVQKNAVTNEAEKSPVGDAPAGVDPKDWEYLTPEQKSLWPR